MLFDLIFEIHNSTELLFMEINEPLQAAATGADRVIDDGGEFSLSLYCARPYQRLVVLHQLHSVFESRALFFCPFLNNRHLPNRLSLALNTKSACCIFKFMAKQWYSDHEK
jgi:hypothetical protein